MTMLGMAKKSCIHLVTKFRNMWISPEQEQLSIYYKKRLLPANKIEREHLRRSSSRQYSTFLRTCFLPCWKQSNNVRTKLKLSAARNQRFHEFGGFLALLSYFNFFLKKKTIPKKNRRNFKTFEKFKTLC